MPTPKSSASTKGSSSTPSCRRRATRWRDRGKRVIVAGLDQDYLGRPFEPMPQLLAIAEYITKTLAICMVCGNPGQPHAAARRQHRPRAGRRAGHLRGAVPALLRSDAVARRGDQAPTREAAGQDAMTLQELAPVLPASPARARRRLFVIVDVQGRLADLSAGGASAAGAS